MPDSTDPNSAGVVSGAFDRLEAFARRTPPGALAAAQAAGMVSFPATLAAVQHFVFRPLRLCAHHRILGTLGGAAAVAVAGVAAHHTFFTIACHDVVRRYAAGNIEPEELLEELRDTCVTQAQDLVQHANDMLEVVSTQQPLPPPQPPRSQEEIEELLQLYDPRRWLPPDRHALEASVWRNRERLLTAGVALGVFVAVGGRFRAVAPSSLWHPGAFARGSVPARGAAYAGSSQKEALNDFGRRTGCHSCGDRRAAPYIGDHMPPNSLVRAGESQRFYPHCKRCSNAQGGSLSSRKHRVITHASSFRIYHIWPPVAPIIAVAMGWRGGSNDGDSWWEWITGGGSSV